MALSAVGGAVTHPLVAELDDEVLRARVQHLARLLLGIPDAARDDC